LFIGFDHLSLFAAACLPQLVRDSGIFIFFVAMVGAVSVSHVVSPEWNVVFEATFLLSSHSKPQR
jgi:hypothetical protein